MTPENDTIWMKYRTYNTLIIRFRTYYSNGNGKPDWLRRARQWVARAGFWEARCERRKRATARLRRGRPASRRKRPLQRCPPSVRRRSTEPSPRSEWRACAQVRRRRPLRRSGPSSCSQRGQSPKPKRDTRGLLYCTLASFNHYKVLKPGVIKASENSPLIVCRPRRMYESSGLSPDPSIWGANLWSSRGARCELKASRDRRPPAMTITWTEVGWQGHDGLRGERCRIRLPDPRAQWKCRGHRRRVASETRHRRGKEQRSDDRSVRSGGLPSRCPSGQSRPIR